jgi:hypothetical protein
MSRYDDYENRPKSTPATVWPRKPRRTKGDRRHPSKKAIRTQIALFGEKHPTAEDDAQPFNDKIPF